MNNNLSTIMLQIINIQIFISCFLLLEIGCFSQENELSIRYLKNYDSLEIYYSNWNDTIRILSGHRNIGISNDLPAFCLDNNNRKLFVFAPLNEIFVYDLIKEVKIGNKVIDFRRKERNYKLEYYNNYIIFSSTRRLLVLDEFLSNEVSIIDSIFKYDETIIDNLCEWKYQIENDSLKFRGYKCKWISKNGEMKVVNDETQPIIYNVFLKTR